MSTCPVCLLVPAQANELAESDVPYLTPAECQQETLKEMSSVLKRMAKATDVVTSRSLTDTLLEYVYKVGVQWADEELQHAHAPVACCAPGCLACGDCSV